ncbi:hypothetical protein COOONC_16702, partial [Cooperia oncophora]
MPTKAHKIDADFGGITLDLAAAQRHVWNSDIASYIELSKVALKPTRALAKGTHSVQGMRCDNLLLFSQENILCTIRTSFHEWIRQQNFDIVVSGRRRFVVTVSTNPLEYVVNALGIPNTPSFVPVNNKGFSVPMTYMERALNLLEYVFTATIIKYTLEPEFDGYFDQKFGKNAWSMQ